MKDPNPGMLEGSGTLEDPYVVNSIEDFIFLSSNVNKGNSYRGQNIVLGMDIDFEGDSYADADVKYRQDGKFGYVKDESSNTTLRQLLTSGEGFIPIGIDGANAYFAGNFNGNGHYIANIYEDSKTFGGIFGYIDSEVNISNLEIKSGTITGKNLVGAIVGEGQTDKVKIKNCINRATVIAKESSNGHVGGIIGHTSGTIENCENYGEISGYRYAGGIMGCAEGSATILNCLNEGNIKSYSNFAAGIIGGGAANIYNCYNTGKIDGYENTGGIAGSVQSSMIVNCYNSGNIESTNATAGGIIASGGQTIKNCYNKGNIKANTLAGGISGSETGTYTNCYNLGNVTTKSDWATVGGIGIYSSCTNCYNSGKISGKNAYSAYEIASASLTNCYYLKRNDGTNVNTNGAQSKTATEMESLMNIKNFVDLMNEYVDSNNTNSSKTKLKTWKIEEPEEGEEDQELKIYFE